MVKNKAALLLKQVTQGKSLLTLVILFVLFSFASAATGIEIEKEAKIFEDALKAWERLPLSNLDEAEKTEDNAYKIQAALFKRILEDTNDIVVGYKGALTADAQITRFRAPGPASAPLLKSGLIEIMDPAAPFTLKLFPGMMLEAEFTFKTAVPITSPVKDEQELKQMMKSLHASIEVPQVYFADMANLSFFDLVAAGVGSRNFVVGPAHGTDLDLDSMPVVLTRDGTVVNEGKGTDVLGGPWKALFWLVNHLVERHGGVEADQYLMTGAVGSMIPAEPGKYVLTFPFETLTFEVVE